jgi:hypothetical protein
LFGHVGLGLTVVNGHLLILSIDGPITHVARSSGLDVNFRSSPYREHIQSIGGGRALIAKTGRSR